MHDGLFRFVGFIKKRRWGLSYAVWHWVFDRDSHQQYTLPYIAQSPISKKKKEFATIDDIWNEIKLITESTKFSIGQQLLYLLPLFANPIYILNDGYFNLINEYHYVTEYNIPLGNNLDDTDADKLVMFNIIKNEIGLALKHKAKKEKNGDSKS